MLEIKIKRICVHSNEFEIDANVKKEKSGKPVSFVKKYYLGFSPGLSWNPYDVVRKIASYMSERTGKYRKVSGRFIRDQMLKITEKEFENKVYYLWSSCRYEYRIGTRGIFKIHYILKGDLYEEQDKAFRMTFGQALFQKEGGKRSDNSWYWLGDYNKTKVEFDPDYGFEPSPKYEQLSTEQYFYLGISLVKYGAEAMNEEYIWRGIGYLKLIISRNKKNAAAYINWASALLMLAQFRRSETLFLESLKVNALAQKYKKDLYSVYLNRGVALYNLADYYDKPNLYEKAINNFKKSIKIKSDHWYTYFACAQSMNKLASINDDTELLRDCCEYYRKALQYNKNNSTCYGGLARSLAILGEKTKDEKYFKESIYNFKVAIKHDDKDALTYLDWGVSLGRYYELVEKDDLIKQSTDLVFNAFLLTVLQRKWEFAIHIAVSALLHLAKKAENENVFLVTTVYLDCIQMIDSKKKIDNELTEKLIKLKGSNKEADIVINAMLGEGKASKVSKGQSNNLVLKSALLLSKEITLKR